jgi:hypothetical protein
VDLHEYQLLWEQNGKLLPQLAPHFTLTTLLAHALRLHARYLAQENPHEAMTEYLVENIRHYERAIVDYNKSAPETPISLPDYSSNLAESDGGAHELEVLAMEAAKGLPLLVPILETSLKHGLYGNCRDVVRAVDAWEALLYFYPRSLPGALLFTLVGKATQITTKRHNSLFTGADELLRLDLPAWTCHRNEDSLEAWLKEVPALIGSPMVFEAVDELSSVARVALWLRVLIIGNWTGSVMIQPV